MHAGFLISEGASTSVSFAGLGVDSHLRLFTYYPDKDSDTDKVQVIQNTKVFYNFSLQVSV